MPYKDPGSEAARASHRAAEQKRIARLCSTPEGEAAYKAKRAEYSRVYYARRMADPDRAKACRQKTREASRRYRTTENGRETLLAGEHRYRTETHGLTKHLALQAKRRGLEFTLTEEEVACLLAPMTCAVTGMSLCWKDGEPGNLLRPSLDRIDNSKGYVPGNVHCVALWVNLARNKARLEEFKEILEQFVALKKGQENG